MRELWGGDAYKGILQRLGPLSQLDHVAVGIADESDDRCVQSAVFERPGRARYIYALGFQLVA